MRIEILIIHGIQSSVFYFYLTTENTEDAELLRFQVSGFSLVCELSH